MATAANARVHMHPPRRPAKPVEDIAIARVFEEVADLLEIQGENTFRIRASCTAARTIETLVSPRDERSRL